MGTTISFIVLALTFSLTLGKSINLCFDFSDRQVRTIIPTLYWEYRVPEDGSDVYLLFCGRSIIN